MLPSGQAYDSIGELHSNSVRRSRRSLDMPPVPPRQTLPGNASGHESPRERRTTRYPDVAIRECEQLQLRGRMLDQIQLPMLFNLLLFPLTNKAHTPLFCF